MKRGTATQAVSHSTLQPPRAYCKLPGDLTERRQSPSGTTAVYQTTKCKECIMQMQANKQAVIKFHLAHSAQGLPCENKCTVFSDDINNIIITGVDH